MARMSHDKADARARAQALINLELQRYARRLKQHAEDYISMKHDEITARGGVFDHKQIAQEAVEDAQRVALGVLEAGDASLTA